MSIHSPTRVMLTGNMPQRKMSKQLYKLLLAANYTRQGLLSCGSGGTHRGRSGHVAEKIKVVDIL